MSRPAGPATPGASRARWRAGSGAELLPWIQLGGALVAFGGFWLAQRALARTGLLGVRRTQARRLRDEDRPSRGWAELVRRSAELGLRPEGDRLVGEVEGAPVWLSGPVGALGPEIALLGVARGLRLSSAGVDARDRTGDKSFDMKYSLMERFAESEGSLDERGRGALVALLSQVSQVGVSDGRLHLHLERWALDRGDPIELTRVVLELARAAVEALRPRGDPDWLATLALGDPQPGARLRAFQAVVAERPVEAPALARRLLAVDSDEDNRGEAALVAGDAAVVAGLSARALGGLFDRHREPLARLLEGAGDEATLIRLVRASMGLEPVRALGRMGGEGARAALRERETAWGAHPNFQAAVIQALAAIDARASSPSGALSLAEPTGDGALAVVQDPGAVALSPEAGRLSPLAGGED